jgi:hypothetical protein
MASSALAVAAMNASRSVIDVKEELEDIVGTCVMPPYLSLDPL